MRIVTVLTQRRQYGLTQEFFPKHVQALKRQCEEHAPFAEFECLTDQRIDGVKTRPLKHGWPGWWSKMELFDPSVPGDFLFLDLDTVLVGSLEDIEKVTELTLLRDFYRDGKKLKEGLGSGLMYVPEEARHEIWDFWMQQPALQMKVFNRGDQHLLEKFYLGTAKRWQDLVPGQICSWKVHCKYGLIPPGTRAICFHGIPRPWHLGQFQNLYG